jgi:hypothetical protein
MANRKRKILIVILVILPLTVGKEFPPPEFYVKKTGSGTYRPEFVWFSLDKEKRNQIIDKL